MIETMNRSPYSKKYESLRAWLKTKREDQNLSIRGLALRLGVHHSIVGKIEQGGRKVDIVEFAEYCEALGVDPHEGLNIIQSSKSVGKELR